MLKLQLDIKDTFSSYGAFTILSDPNGSTKRVEAVAIVEMLHIKTLINPRDKNDKVDENCAAIHYIATNPDHYGIAGSVYIKALYENIATTLSTQKPKVKTVYHVKSASFFEVLDDDENYASFGFEANDHVDFDEKLVVSAPISRFIEQNEMSDDDKQSLGDYEVKHWRNDRFSKLLIEKDENGRDPIIYTVHQFLGTIKIKNAETTLESFGNARLQSSIADAVNEVTEGRQTSVTINNKRAGAISNISEKRACAWEASICLVERYNIETAVGMRNMLIFEKATYSDINLFGNEENTLHNLLQGFGLTLKKPTYTDVLLKGGKRRKVEKKDYKSFVMSATEGLYVCLLKDSNNCSNHAVGIDTSNNRVYDSYTSLKDMPLNEETLKRCCGGLDCIAFEVVGRIH